MQDYAVAGKTPFDQPWIDDTSEAVIAGCDRERPYPRPALWDVTGHPATRGVAGTPTPPAPTPIAIPLPKKKPSVWDKVPHPFKRKGKIK